MHISSVRVRSTKGYRSSKGGLCTKTPVPGGVGEKCPAQHRFRSSAAMNQRWIRFLSQIKRYSFAIFMSELSREHYVPVMIVPSAIAKLNKQKKYVLLSKSTSSQAPLCHGRSDSVRNISLFDPPFLFTDA